MKDVCQILGRCNKENGLYACERREVFWHRVDREDITIIILDTKSVPDFVLHACYFFIAGNRPVLSPPLSASKSLTYGNRGPKRQHCLILIFAYGFMPKVKLLYRVCVVCIKIVRPSVSQIFQFLDLSCWSASIL